jgi:hypothetical protein
MTKIQVGLGGCLDIGSLEFIWSLGFGYWNLPRGVTISMKFFK